MLISSLLRKFTFLCEPKMSQKPAVFFGSFFGSWGRAVNQKMNQKIRAFYPVFYPVNKSKTAAD
jgi:IS30 family transposase